MKKLLTIILIIALALPAAALADSDPIVGSWYMYMDVKTFPELKNLYMDSDYFIMIFNFMENGTILAHEIVITDNVSTPNTYPAGKWEKDENGYKYSIIGVGQNRILLENGYLYLKSGDNEYNIYMKFSPLEKFNPYVDFITK